MTTPKQRVGKHSIFIRLDNDKGKLKFKGYVTMAEAGQIIAFIKNKKPL